MFSDQGMLPKRNPHKSGTIREWCRNFLLATSLWTQWNWWFFRPFIGGPYPCHSMVWRSALGSCCPSCSFVTWSLRLALGGWKFQFHRREKDRKKKVFQHQVYMKILGYFSRSISENLWRCYWIYCISGFNWLRLRGDMTWRGIDWSNFPPEILKSTRIMFLKKNCWETMETHAPKTLFLVAMFLNVTSCR